jgi:hypothetical protein
VVGFSISGVECMCYITREILNVKCEETASEEEDWGK